MRSRHFVATAVALVLLAGACTGGGKKTVISGTLPLDYRFIDSLAVYFEDSLIVSEAVDTVSGAYKLTIPADITKLAILTSLYFQTPFISDGTPLTLLLKAGENPTLVGAKDGVAGLTGRLNNYQKAVMAIQNTMVSVMQEYEDAGYTEEQFLALSDSLFAPQYAKMKDLNINTIRENSDNVLAVYALMSSEMDADFPALLQGLSPEMKARKDIKALLSQIEYMGATSIGSRFLDFEASLDCNNLEGTKVHLSDSVGHGKFILLDFWASWCGPCREEMPYIKSAYEKFVGENFDVVSVAINDNPDQSAIAAVDLGMVWNILIGAGGKPGEIYGVSTIPHLILFGPDGTILARGFRGEEIESVIDRFTK